MSATLTNLLFFCFFFRFSEIYQTMKYECWNKTRLAIVKTFLLVSKHVSCSCFSVSCIIYTSHRQSKLSDISFYLAIYVSRFRVSSIFSKYTMYSPKLARVNKMFIIYIALLNILPPVFGQPSESQHCSQCPWALRKNPIPTTRACIIKC